MNAKVYLAILQENKWVVLATFAATVIIAGVVTFLITPIYSAKAILRVATASGGSVNYSDTVYADRLMNTYTRIATSRPLLDALSQKLNVDVTKTPVLKVTTIPLTELLQITAESPNPVLAQEAANTLADMMVTQSKEFYTGSGKSTVEILSDQMTQAQADLDQARKAYNAYVKQSPSDKEGIANMERVIQINEDNYAALLRQYEDAMLRETIRANTISVVDPAQLPLAPSRPNRVLNILLGMVVGLTGGIGLAFFFENLNPRLYTSRQIESAAEMAVIGKVPLAHLSKPTSNNGHSAPAFLPFTEAIRGIRMSILAQNQNNNEDCAPVRNLLITSAVPGEGKSTISYNLGKSLAQMGQKTVLVDCDMRLPSQHKLFNLNNKSGLSNILKDNFFMDCADCVIQSSELPHLDVITSGPAVSDPTGLLASPQMRSLIEQLDNHYDIVILDTPALLTVADASAVANLADSAILIARRKYIREDTVRDACKKLAETRARIIGLVVNDAEPSSPYHRYYYS